MEPIDPNVCPHCGAEGTFSELQRRPTWQPVTLRLNPNPDGPDQRRLIEGDYSSFDYGDEVEVSGYNCRECEYTWDNLGELYSDMVLLRLGQVLSCGSVGNHEARELTALIETTAFRGPDD